MLKSAGGWATSASIFGVRHFSRFSRSGPVGIQRARLAGPRSNFHFQYGPVVDLDQPLFSESVSAEAAPAPKLRGGHQAARHGIAMDVAQLLDALAIAPNIEIVEAFLPDMLRSALEQFCLRRVA